MSSETIIQTIKNSHSVLQESLIRGWQEFQYSEQFALTEQLYYKMNWWYSSQFSGVIPNPAHWYAGQLSAKYFLVEIGKLGLYLETLFPGDFSQSIEFEREDGLDVRRFKVTGFHHSESTCLFQLDYIHKHETFYFLEPPQLSIFEL